MINQEQYNAVAVAANGTQILRSATDTSVQIGGFLCTTDGTMKVALGVAGDGADIVKAFAVLAGIFYPIPYSPGAACALVLSGGATGTVFMNS